MFAERADSSLDTLALSYDSPFDLDQPTDPLTTMEVLKPWILHDRDEEGKRFAYGLDLKKFYTRIWRQFRATHGVMKELSAVVRESVAPGQRLDRARTSLTGKWGLMEKRFHHRLTLTGVPDRLRGELDLEVWEGLVELVTEGNLATEALRPWIESGAPLTGDPWDSAKAILTKYADAIKYHHMDGSDPECENEYGGIYCPVCGHKVQGVDGSGVVCTSVEPCRHTVFVYTMAGGFEHQRGKKVERWFDDAIADNPVIHEVLEACPLVDEIATTGTDGGDCGDDRTWYGFHFGREKRPPKGS